MTQVRPRVGIVLVSHSARLAEGAADLAGQVSGGTVPVLAAGGTDDGELGTSAEKIGAAVASAETGAGVLVLPTSAARCSPCARCSRTCRARAWCSRTRRS